MLKFKNRYGTVFLIHKNKNKNLIKKYKKFISKNFFILEKIKFLFINFFLFKINDFLKNEKKKIRIFTFIIWNSKHNKEIKKILINLLKINKKLKIKISKNFGKLKIIKKIIKI